MLSFTCQLLVIYDMENCLDLAIRKGKVVGETKPTESNESTL